jgi:hypothetical protein
VHRDPGSTTGPGRGALRLSVDPVLVGVQVAISLLPFVVAPYFIRSLQELYKLSQNLDELCQKRRFF